jgi:hypothetical protein
MAVKVIGIVVTIALIVGGAFVYAVASTAGSPGGEIFGIITAGLGLIFVVLHALVPKPHKSTRGVSRY